jgi:rhomboid protease GluP
MSLSPGISESDAAFPALADLEGRAVAGWYASSTEAFNHSLVIVALGYACWLIPHEGGECLLVEPVALEYLREQLERSDQESVGWPPRPRVEPPADPSRGIFPPLLWALVVVAVFREQSASSSWVVSGALDARALFVEGEWWRPFTALWLHADVGHLVSNLVGGYFVLRGWFALTTTLRGWLALLGASVLANVLVAAAHFPNEYRSLGASTLVFAGLGLLTGRALRYPRLPGRWRPLFVPFAAGLAMLGLFGAGGENIDVLAHVAGFATGTLAGWMVSRSSECAES